MSEIFPRWTSWPLFMSFLVPSTFFLTSYRNNDMPEIFSFKVQCVNLLAKLFQSAIFIHTEKEELKGNGTRLWRKNSMNWRKVYLTEFTLSSTAIPKQYMLDLEFQDNVTKFWRLFRDMRDATKDLILSTCFNVQKYNAF